MKRSRTCPSKAGSLLNHRRGSLCSNQKRTTSEEVAGMTAAFAESCMLKVRYIADLPRVERLGLRALLRHGPLWVRSNAADSDGGLAKGSSLHSATHTASRWSRYP